MNNKKQIHQRNWSRRDFLAAASVTGVLSVNPLKTLASAADSRDDNDQESLEKSFLHPSMAARPSIWWYWGESTTTEQGITHDLEAYKRVGFGGVVIYEQVFSDSPDALKSLSPEWMARVRFAAAECARLGMVLEFNVSDGYVAGGPWITPDLGMQRLIESELTLEGGRAFSAPLPLPRGIKLDYYKDIAVLAYPTPAGVGDVPPVPKVTSTPAGLDLQQLFDPDARSKISIGPGPVLIEMHYDRPFTARSLSFSERSNTKALVIITQVPGNWSDDPYGTGAHLNLPIGHLEASSDGIRWEHCCDLPAKGYQQDSWDRMTVAFPAMTATIFRLNLYGPRPDFPSNGLMIGNVELRSAARIDRWESKSGNVADFSNADRTPGYTGDEAIDPSKIVDLTHNLTPDGRLNWDVPPGRWTVLRLCHTPTGAATKHGRPETLGMECDKLSSKASVVQFENYIGRILKEIQSVPGAKLAGIGMDSAEHGSQNWTSDFPAQFQKRRNYDLLRYLPTMVGRVVGSNHESDRFLFDARRTIADVMSDEYYGTFQTLCHAQAMTLTAQAPGIATCLPSDNIQAKGRTDVPMGEFWTSQPNGTMDCKEAACAAHVYGLTVAAAESFTGSHSDTHPATIKSLADAALALGINHFVVLAGVHQPWDNRSPGVTQVRYLLPYQRHNTWWEYSGGFWNTLARSSQMMRQGIPVMDILYHLGNDTPLKIATSRMRPAPPEGYDYDVCGDEILLRASVRDGQVTLPGGMNYRVLILAGGDRMSVASIRQLQTLVMAGATVLGPVKPVGSPGLSDGDQGDAEVRRIADELWGPGPMAAAGAHTSGKGRIAWGLTPAALLNQIGAAPDFEPSPKPNSSTDILYAHRRTANEDIYFISNHRPESVSFTGTFRVPDSIPQAWDPETGEFRALTGFHANQGRTEIPLWLEQNSSLFVVFRKGPAPKRAVPALMEKATAWRDISSDWAVSFDPILGGPGEVVFPKLASWTEDSRFGIQHYSGTAIYTRMLQLPKIPSSSVILDLGRVEVVASVTVNGQDMGTLWKAPFAVDVTEALHPGANRIEVKVANLWANRLTADAGLPEAKRVSWILYNPYKADDKLLPSGLMGPVVIRILPPGNTKLAQTRQGGLNSIPAG